MYGESERKIEWIQGNFVVRLSDASGSTGLRVYDKDDTLVWSIDSDGHHHDVTRYVDLPASGNVWNGYTSFRFVTDGDSHYANLSVPTGWDGASNLTLAMLVGNGIAEDDGDDVSFTCTVRGYTDGDTASAAGQSCPATLNLTGGDQGINRLNRVTATIDYDHGTYAISAGDTISIVATVNLGGAGECTGPLYLVAWRLEYTADRLGG